MPEQIPEQQLPPHRWWHWLIYGVDHHWSHRQPKCRKCGRVRVSECHPSGYGYTVEWVDGR